MQKSIRHFVEICVEHLPIQPPVYEFGALQVRGDPDEDLRPLFGDVDYVGADMRAGPGVDRVLDLHAIDLPNGTAGTVLCMDTLEHVEHPRTAVEEIHRILAPGGLVITSSVFDFPIHGYPNDYWRFTPEGFRSLLKPFSVAMVSSYGRSDVSPQNVIGVGFKDTGELGTEFERAITQWSNWYSGICRRLNEADTGK